MSIIKGVSIIKAINGAIITRNDIVSYTCMYTNYNIGYMIQKYM